MFDVAPSSKAQLVPVSGCFRSLDGLPEKDGLRHAFRPANFQRRICCGVRRELEAPRLGHCRPVWIREAHPPAIGGESFPVDGAGQLGSVPAGKALPKSGMKRSIDEQIARVRRSRAHRHISIGSRQTTRSVLSTALLHARPAPIPASAEVHRPLLSVRVARASIAITIPPEPPDPRSSTRL